MKAILIAIATLSCIGIYSPISPNQYRPVCEYFEPPGIKKVSPVIFETKEIKRKALKAKGWK